MSNDEQHIELARRLVACPQFRWMPGMLTMAGRLIAIRDGDDGDDELVIGWWSEENIDVHWWLNRGELPDLRDAATLGCVLALVREAWGDGELTMFDGAKLDIGGLFVIRASSTAEALVVALERAP